MNPIILLVLVTLLAGCGGAPFTDATESLGTDGGGTTEITEGADGGDRPDTGTITVVIVEAAVDAGAATADADLPGLDGGAGAAANSGGVTEDGSSSDGSSTSSGSASSSGSVASSSGSSGSSNSGGSSSSGSSSSGGGSSSSGGDDAGDSDAGCSMSAIQCAGLQPQTCVSGVWINSGGACSGATPVCLNGACAACSPGTVQCSSTTQPETCGSTGTWQNATACVNQACVSGACTGVCKPGATQCAGGAQLNTCSTTGQWVTTTCPGMGGCCTAAGTAADPAAMCATNIGGECEI